MKKLSIFSIVLLNSTFIPSLFGMITITPRKILSLSKTKCNFSTKHDDTFNRSQRDPDAPLKSPKMVLKEIKLYWDKINKTDSSYQQAHRLLNDALFASHMCNEINTIEPNLVERYYQKHHELRLKNHRRFMNEWHKKHHHINYKTYDAIQSGIYHDMNGWNDKETEECKQKLAHEIMNLRKHYTDQLKHIKNKSNE